MVRAYALTPLANERRGVQAGDVGVTALDPLPKQCAVPFAGNELRFEVGATGGFCHQFAQSALQHMLVRKDVQGINTHRCQAVGKLQKHFPVCA